MDLRVYPFKRTLMHTVWIGGGVVVIACGLAFLCADIPLGVYIATSGPGPLILVGMGVLSAVGLILCLVGGALLYFGSRSYTAVLSATDFSFGPRGRTKTLKLADITSVTLVYSSQVIRVYPWQVVIQDAQQQQIRLPIGRWAGRKFTDNIFDYQSLLRDLLQRLPPTVTVDEKIRKFVDTGQFS